MTEVWAGHTYPKLGRARPGLQMQYSTRQLQHTGCVYNPTLCGYNAVAVAHLLSGSLHQTRGGAGLQGGTHCGAPADGKAGCAVAEDWGGVKKQIKRQRFGSEMAVNGSKGPARAQLSQRRNSLVRAATRRRGALTAPRAAAASAARAPQAAAPTPTRRCRGRACSGSTALRPP